ncbi:MAG: GNAT family N-acetyltransferase [Mucispirillum sp.]|nr:GNAT family N-acetyltransferase [Mucispirillum sp.]
MIKRYIQSDYSPLTAIWERSVLHTHDFLSKEDYKLIHSKLPEYFSDVDIFVYEKAYKIAAFMGISDNKIEMLFCDPDYFRQGIGSSMIYYAVQLLHIKYVDVNELNNQAVEFYKSMNFIVIGRQEHDIFGYALLHLMYNGSN